MRWTTADGSPWPQGRPLPWALHAVQAAVHDESWHDPRRERDLQLRLRWPDGDAPCALVVHAHGLGGNRNGGDVWGRAWQRAGFAVLHLQHPGSDTEVLRRGLPALRAGPLKREAVAVELEPQHHERIATLTSLWWRAKLLGDAGAAAALQAPAGLGPGDRWQQD